VNPVGATSPVFLKKTYIIGGLFPGIQAGTKAAMTVFTIYRNNILLQAV
jgi:hypothetical protein